MDKEQLLQKAGYYTVKAFSISYIYVIQFLLSFLVALALNKVFKDFDASEADKKSSINLVIEIMGQLVLVGILSFVIRNIMSLFPYPLDGVYGVETKRIKEFVSAPVIPFILLFFYRNLKDKMSYLFNRLR